MNKRLAMLGLCAGVFLSACSSSANNADENNTQATTEPTTQPTTINGFGEAQTQRYKVAVLPTRVDAANLPIPSLSQNILSQSISHELSRALNETHKFDIVVPNAIQQPVAENVTDDEEVTEGDNAVTPAPKDDSIADYLLHSTLTQIDASETLRILKATGQGVNEKVVFIALNYQIVNAKTNQVALTKTVRYQLKDTGYNTSVKQTVENAIGKVADIVKDQIINDIYPVRVVAVLENGEIVLDQPLTVNSQCQLFTTGAKITDTYSNRLLGHEEKLVGLATISRTTDVFSFAKVNEGQATKENICKLIPIDQKVALEYVKQTEGGGVLLPFDR